MNSDDEKDYTEMIKEYEKLRILYGEAIDTLLAVADYATRKKDTELLEIMNSRIR